MTGVHAFAESLAASHAQADAPWWGEVYESAFPGLLSMSSVRNDGWAQRAGIDRVLVLSSGKVLTVDEKVRAKDYGDILLEIWSSEKHQTPGWVRKDLACDFIAYAFVPSRRCYLLPFPALYRAWKIHAQDWWPKAQESRGGFRRVEAKNEGYTTVSVAVPTDTLLSAMGKAMVVEWGST